MFNLDHIINRSDKDHIKKWPSMAIPDHSYRMLITGDFASGKTNALLNLIKKQDSDNLISY